MKKNKKLIIILVLAIVAFLLILTSIYLSGNSKKNISENQYRISDKIVEFEGTNIIKNDQLIEGHCLDNICVKDVTIYDTDGEGRIEYTVVNNGSTEISDILKLNFGDSYTYIIFSALQPNQSVKSKTMYRKGNYNNVEDFTIEKLSKEEFEKIKNY